MRINTKRLKKVLTYIGYLLVIFSFYFLGKVLIDNIDVLSGVELSTANIIILSTSLCLYFIGFFLFCFAWLLQLKEKYPEFSFRDSLSIIGRSQIGKYFPGNVGHFVGRVVLLPEYISKKDVTYTMFIENITILISSALIGGFYFRYFNFFKKISSENIIFILAGFFLISLITYFFLNQLRKKFDFLRIKKRVFFKILTLNMISTLIGGVSIYILATLFVDESSITYLQCVTGFALSFIVGFVIPGAPGGIGIREFTFVMLFGTFITDVAALEIILSFRVVSVIGDILIFSGASLIKK